MLTSLALLAVLVHVTPASAQVVTPFTPRFQTDVTGNIDLIGNTVMTCPLTAANCATARTGTASPVSNNNNNNYVMIQVDVDSDASTFNSSRSVLNMPDGAEVLWAGLYWGGDTLAGPGGTAAPNAALRLQVRFATPTTPSYETVIGTLLGSTTTTLGTDYGVFADVTPQVQAAGNGAYTVANVQVGTGQDKGGGWSLIVAYRAPTLPARNLVIFDGFANVSPNTTVTINVSGFQTPPAGTVTCQLGVMTWEGDLGFPGDSFRLNSTVLSNGLNPATNFFNGSITQGGVRLSAKNPDYVNQLSLDIDRLPANGVLANSSMSATITLSTTSDAFYPGAVTFATDIFSPTLVATKTSSDRNGGVLLPGDILDYTVTVINTGLDNAAGIVLQDLIPPGTSYVSGSLAVASGANAGAKSDAADADQAEFDMVGNRVVFRLGTGANGAVGGTLAPNASTSVRFAVRIDPAAGNGAQIINQATLDYRAATLGSDLTSSSNQTLDQVLLPTLELSKIDTPDPVAAGDDVTYQLSYRNSGSATAQNVMLTDAVPADTTFVSATSGGTLSGGVVTWNLGPLVAGAGGSVSMTVQVDNPIANNTQISNIATLSADNAGSVQDTATTLVTSDPFLVLEKSDTPDPVEAGGIITYTLDFANIGSDIATGVVLEDPLPPLTTFVSATGGGTLVGAVVTWNLGDVAAGSSGSVTFSVLVDSPLADGTLITNAATLSATNAAQAQAQTTTTVSSAAFLALAKTAQPEVVEAGGQVTYSLSYSNIGNDAAQDTFLVDQLPPQVDFVSATGGGVYDVTLHQVTWSFGSLPAGDSGTVSILVQAVSPLTNGILLRNTATLSATGVADAQAQADVRVTSAPVLSLNNSAGPEPVEAGGTLTYGLVFANSGNADATGVVLEDIVPGRLTFVAATGGGSYDPGTRTVSWNFGTLGVGQSGSVAFTATVDSPLANGTQIVNTASLDSAETQPITAQAVSTVSSAPKLQLEKSATPDAFVAAGDPLTYTLSFANVGNTEAINAVLEDVLPAGTTFVAAPGGGTFDGTTVTWNLGTLVAGQAGTRTLIVNVVSPLANGTLLHNTATLNADNATPAVADADTRVTSAPVLQLTKADSSDPVQAGDLLVYTLTYANVGSTDATDLVLEDVLPASVTFVSASAGGSFAGGFVTWNLGTLAAGAGGQVTVTVQVDSPLPNGILLVNTATLSSAETQPVSVQEPTTVNSAPVLKLIKTADRDPVAPGEQLVYSISVTNNGNDNATSVVLVDQLPAETDFVAASSGGSFDPGSGQVTWNQGVLAPGSSALVTLTVVVDDPLADGTLLVNLATVSSNETAPITASVTTTVTNPGTQTAALALTKSATPSPVEAGVELLYTLSYGSVGTGPVDNAVIVDQLPVHLDFVSATGGGIFDSVARTVTWSLGTLASGVSGHVSVTTLLTPPVEPGTLLVNVATLTGDNTPSATATTQTPVLVPQLELVKQAQPSAVELGGTVLFELFYANVGDGTATNVTLIDFLPMDVEPITISDGGIYDPVAGTITWNLGSLAPSASSSVSVLAQILAADLVDGVATVINRAELSSTETSPLIAIAEVTVTEGPIVPVVDIPTLTGTSLALFALLLMAAGLWLRAFRRSGGPVGG